MTIALILHEVDKNSALRETPLNALTKQSVKNAPRDDCIIYNLCS